MNVSILALWNDSGGFARGIIVVLAFMSVMSIGVAVAKWWRLRRSTRETAKFAPEFGRFLQEDQLDAAVALAEKQKVSHVARVLGEALAEVKPLLRDRAAVTIFHLADSDDGDFATFAGFLAEIEIQRNRADVWEHARLARIQAPASFGEEQLRIAMDQRPGFGTQVIEMDVVLRGKTIAAEGTHRLDGSRCRGLGVPP